MHRSRQGILILIVVLGLFCAVLLPVMGQDDIDGRPTTGDRGIVIITNPLPPPLHATIDVTCASGRTFTISTGTKGGTCQSGGEKGVSTCTDSTDGGSGGSTVDCGLDGKGGCTSAVGAGSCTKK